MTIENNSYETVIQHLMQYDVKSNTTLDFKLTKYTEEIVNLLRDEAKARGISLRSIIKGDSLHVVIQGNVLSIIYFFEFAKGLFIGLEIDANRRKQIEEEETNEAARDELIKALPKI